MARTCVSVIMIAINDISIFHSNQYQYFIFVIQQLHIYIISKANNQLISILHVLYSYVSYVAPSLTINGDTCTQNAHMHTCSMERKRTIIIIVIYYLLGTPKLKMTPFPEMYSVIFGKISAAKFDRRHIAYLLYFQMAHEKEQK